MMYLAFFFNLERLEAKAGIGGVSVHTFVYILMISAVVFIFLLSKIQRFSVFIFLFFWSFVYFALRLTIFNDSPVFGGMSTYITVTELAILLMAIALAYRCTKYLGEFEKFVEEVYIPNLGKRILKMDNASEEIKTEFIRSRRHQLPMALVAIEPSSTTKKEEAEIKKAVEEIQRHMTSRFIAASLAKIIMSEARRSDLIINQGDDGQFFILCPETKGNNSVVLAERIRLAAEEHLGIHIKYGVASFPEEAYTFEELVQRATLQLNLDTKEKIITETPTFLYGEAAKIK